MWAFSLYNSGMKHKIAQRIRDLSGELEDLVGERKAINLREQEIDIRTHQLVGAIFELQQLINLDYQPSVGGRPEDPFATADWVRPSTHPSEDGDQDSHQEQQEETEKNSPQQS